MTGDSSPVQLMYQSFSMSYCSINVGRFTVSVLFSFTLTSFSSTSLACFFSFSSSSHPLHAMPLSSMCISSDTQPHALQHNNTTATARPTRTNTNCMSTNGQTTKRPTSQTTNYPYLSVYLFILRLQHRVTIPLRNARLPTASPPHLSNGMEEREKPKWNIHPARPFCYSYLIGMHGLSQSPPTVSRAQRAQALRPSQAKQYALHHRGSLFGVQHTSYNTPPPLIANINVDTCLYSLFFTSLFLYQIPLPTSQILPPRLLFSFFFFFLFFFLLQTPTTRHVTTSSPSCLVCPTA